MSSDTSPVGRAPDGAVMRQGEAVAGIHDVSKWFGGEHALKDVSIELAAAEVHCLVGENGAGKSTVVKILSGVYEPDRGEVRIGADREEIHTPQDALRLGIRTIYQEHALAPDMTVAENMALGHEPTAGLRFVLSRRRRTAEAAQVLEQLGIEGIDPNQRTGDLGIAQQQLVEIAKAMARGGEQVVILDEATALLTPDETERLFAIVRRLRDRGVCVLYITHRLEELDQIGDRVSVLRDGEIVHRAAVGELDTQGLIEQMVGRRIEHLYPDRAVQAGEPILDIAPRGSNVNHLSVREGEVVGLFGLVGAGRTELVREAIGADRGSAAVSLEGNPLKLRSVRAAFEAGIGFVPEDRKTQGIVPEMSVSENIALSSLGSQGPLLHRRAIEGIGAQYIKQLRIQTSSPSQPIMFLSGGNQQKCILARALAVNPRVMILDEPTRGVDVGARSEIYTLINGLCARGCGVLMITSELLEVLGMADRIYVFREGEIVGELAGNVTQEDVMALAVGATKNDESGP